MSGRVKVAKQIHPIMRAKLNGFGTGGEMSISEGDPELGSETRSGRASAMHHSLAPSRPKWWCWPYKVNSS